MIIAVMSDSHDNIWNMRKALAVTQSKGADTIIHCGDFIAPFMLKELETAGIPVHAVFGNNDGDQYLLTRLALTSLVNIRLHGLVGKIDAEGFATAFTHEPEVAEGLAATGKYRMVCHGHSHRFRQDLVGDTILLNPGEIMGKDGAAGFCLVDTKTAKVEKVRLANL